MSSGWDELTRCFTCESVCSNVVKSNGQKDGSEVPRQPITPAFQTYSDATVVLFGGHREEKNPYEEDMAPKLRQYAHVPVLQPEPQPKKPSFKVGGRNAIQGTTEWGELQLETSRTAMTIVEAEDPQRMCKFNQHCGRVFGVGKRTVGRSFAKIFFGRGTEPNKQEELSNRLSHHQPFDVPDILLYKYGADPPVAMRCHIKIWPLIDNGNRVQQMLIDICSHAKVSNDYQTWSERRSDFIHLNPTLQTPHLDKRYLEEHREARILALALGNSVSTDAIRDRYTDDPFINPDAQHIRVVKSNLGRRTETVRTNNCRLVTENPSRESCGVMRTVRWSSAIRSLNHQNRIQASPSTQCIDLDSLCAGRFPRRCLARRKAWSRCTKSWCANGSDRKWSERRRRRLRGLKQLISRISRA